MYTKILVATDGSKLSNKAVTEAAQLAGLAGAKLLLLYVQQPYDAPRAEETAPGGLGVMRRLQEARAAAAEALLHAASKLAEKQKVNAFKKIVEDYSPYNAIIKTAKKEKCDLIVMASHGRRGLSAVLMGSETQKVLTHSPVPVLVVR